MTSDADEAETAKPSGRRRTRGGCTRDSQLPRFLLGRLLAVDNLLDRLVLLDSVEYLSVSGRLAVSELLGEHREHCTEGGRPHARQGDQTAKVMAAIQHGMGIAREGDAERMSATVV